MYLYMYLYHEFHSVVSPQVFPLPLASVHQVHFFPHYRDNSSKQSSGGGGGLLVMKYHQSLGDGMSMVCELAEIGCDS